MITMVFNHVSKSWDDPPYTTFMYIAPNEHLLISFPHLSHEKNPLTFHYTGWLVGILIMAYYDP